MRPRPRCKTRHKPTPVPSYDKNGNELTSTPATLTWDALNQPATVNSTSATYDALGRMVETGVSGVYTQFVFRPSGDLLAVYKGSLVKGTLPLPGGEAAVYNSTGLNFLRHKDWLGSSRLATTWTHTVYSRVAYAPFGETYNESGSTPDRSFTGQDQNVVTGSAGSGVYDYLFRKYDPSAGRWLSPDPLGWGAVDATDPQSLDRYAYVENQPMSLVDPNGLLLCIADKVSSDGKLYGYDSGDQPCGAGFWSYDAVTTVTVNSNSDSCSDANMSACPSIQYGYTAGPNIAYPDSGYGPGSGYVPQYTSYKGLFCAGDALAGNSVALGLDAAGFIPGESQTAAVGKTIVAGASFANSLYHKDAVGASAAIIGGQTTLVGAAAKSVGVSWAKAVPFLGYVVNGIATAHDLLNTASDYKACMASSKYD